MKRTATEEEAIQSIQDAIHEYLATRDELSENAVLRAVGVASCNVALRD